MGGQWLSPSDGIQAVDEWLGTKLGDGWELAPSVTEYHKLAYDEIAAFDYEAFKANNFEPIHLGDVEIPKEILEYTTLQYEITSKYANA